MEVVVSRRKESIDGGADTFARPPSFSLPSVLIPPLDPPLLLE